MTRIDLKDILQQTVSGVYGDLVTRRTGQAVRGGIERVLERVDREQVSAIDFGTVRCLDLSCADEIVGKLLLQYGRVRYFILVGLDEGHRDAIEAVLERHDLAVVARDRAGVLRLLGAIPEQVRRAFHALVTSGTPGAETIATALAVPPDAARALLDDLLAHRVVLEDGGDFQPLRVA